MSTVFLFGAGASFGSGPCEPKNPPLGTRFFEELRSAGGIASTVDERLAEIFAEDFEKGMDAFMEQRAVEITPLLQEMAKYFAGFEPLEGNLYRELIKTVERKRKKAVYVTTNYDLLIERSAMQENMIVSYGGLPAPDNNISLLKIHGSCNFLPDLGGSSIRGVGFDVSNSDASVLESAVKVARSTQEILDFCKIEDSIAPAVAMYSEGKRVLFCRRFVEEQREKWVQEIQKATRVYAIGLRVHPLDDHIWGELARSKARIYYAGGEPDEFLGWAEKNGKRNCYAIANRFDEALPIIERHLSRR